jgi:DNA-binding GntR family transcriptional regulator
MEDGILSSGVNQVGAGNTDDAGAAFGTADDGEALYRRSLSSQIAQRVRADILAGRLSPGQRVSQHKLAQTYGTSRIPARDALRELEQEGFLIKGAAGGTPVVSRVTADDITDVFSILATALACATRRATRAATAEGIASLRAIHARMSEAAAQGNVSATFGELNWSLHRQITRLAGSDKLRATIRSISSSIPVAYPEFPLPVAEIVAEKGAILDAIEAGDAGAAAALMEVHVKKEGAGLVDYIHRRELLEG